MNLLIQHEQSVEQLTLALTNEDGSTARAIVLDGAVSDLEMFWIVCGALAWLDVDEAELLAFALNENSRTAIPEARALAPSMIRIARDGDQGLNACLKISQMQRVWGITVIAICQSHTDDFAKLVQRQFNAIFNDPENISHD